MKSFFRLSLALIALLGLCLIGASAQSIHLNAGTIETVRASQKPLARAVTADVAGVRLHLVQFDGPIQPEWVEQLEQNGFQIVDYIPDNAYLVYGGLPARQGLRARTKHVKWEGAYLAAHKIHPRARPEAAKSRRDLHGEDDLFAVQLVLDDQPNAETVALLTSLAREPLKRNKVFRHYRNIVVRMDPAEVETIAARPDVISIAPYVVPQKFDERQAIIVSGQLTGNLPSGPGYLAWLTSKGFTQQQFTDSGLVVDVCDSGIDNGSVNANHFGLYVSGNTGLASRVAYARLEGTPNSGSTIQGCDGHGTLNAHIIGGYNNSSAGFPHQDSAGYRYGLGIAPFVKVGSSTIFDSNEFTSPDYEDMISRAYRDGARISSDSWGADTYGGYDIDAQQYDALVRDAQQAGSAVSVAGNQPMTIVFAAGNAGSGAGSVGSPGTAKNVITVGAAENVHSHAITNRGASTTGLDGCDTPDSEANSANDIVGFSSRGPCSDGRKKPEIVAPGTHVTGGVAQQVKAMAGNGNDLECFDASGVCGLQDDSGNYVNFFPTNQQWYSTSSGTSHSTPAVAGGAALVYQYFLNQGWNAPSPAMIKAFLMNSARYMTGVDANDALWSNNQGMGMMNLGLAFDGAGRIRRDQLSADTFTASGQSRAISGRPVDTNKPVRITLSWTDAPGSTSGNAYKNNLDLSVSTAGKTYLGNVFNGALSAVGGTADARNNTESVFLPAGTTGAVVVVVTAANINSDGVPNVAPALDQDYALVIYNFEEVQMPVVVGTGSSLQQESCGVVGNGAIDPDETVTVGFVLQNAGTANTTNVVATLLATGGVVNPDGPASYGALLAGGAPKTNAFTFAATGECGGILTATLALADNGVDLGLAEFTFRLGGTIGAMQAKTNSTRITLNDNASASPYPSTIAISGMAGTISKVTATLRGFTHTWPSDVDIILVSPGGQAVSLMGAAGGGTSVSGATLTFDDDAASALGEPIISGTYQPSGMAEAMNSPAPQPPYGAALADFNGGDPNGTWKLYGLDAAASDSGSIAQGWALSVTAAEPLCCGSNKPPIFAALGNQSVIESNRLSFAVVATDPYDGDPITLTASNLPAGATFPLTNGVGSSTGTFIWESPEPTGTYAVSFYAEDKDGMAEKTISVTVLPTPFVDTNCMVIISEYVEGSSNNKAIEIFNPTAEAIDLGAEQYVVMGYQNGSSTAGYTIPLSGIIPSQGFFVLANSSASAAILNVADLTSATLTFNGDDAVVLRAGGTSGTIVDSLGQVGFDPGSEWGSGLTSTADNTLRRKATVKQGDAVTGDAFDPAVEWDGFALDTFDGLGAHTSDCTGPALPTPPTLNPVGNRAIQLGSNLQFQVTATPTDGDVVTLTASNLPGTATFTATNENGSFEWLAASPTGVFSVTFYATDKDGADAETISITVSSNAPVDTNCTMIISEYVEGSSNNKVVEMFNPSAEAINLGAGGYVIQVYPNGGTSPTTINLTGIVAAAGTYVLANSTAGAAFLALANQVSGSLTHNGDDAIVLRSGGSSGAILDSIGVVGVDPGTAWANNGISTLDQTLRRKFSIKTGDVTATDAFDPSVEWEAFAKDASDGLGWHTNECTGAVQPTPPLLNPIGNKSVTVDQDLQFQVVATPTDGDVVTLTASNLPAGASFDSTNEVGTFFWAAAAPTGVYSVTFYAEDKDGTDAETIAITVGEAVVELLAPVIQAATEVQATQFNANWLASAGATGYRLDAATNSAFRHTMGMRTAALSAGDLLIVTADSDATEGFDAVPLVDLDAGTVIYFTDNGWTNGTWRTNEGTVVYTAPSAIAAGTVLSYRSANANGFVKSGSFDLSASGDNILAYQGSAGSPQFLYGIGWAAATPWIESGTVTANNSMIPSGLSVGAFTIVAAGNYDNCQYDSTKGTVGTKAALLELVANSANWTGNDTTPHAKFTPDFTVGSGPAINDFVPGFENLDVGNVTTFAVTGLTEGVTYYYRAKAYNATSNSPYSAVTSVVTAASSGTPPVLNPIGGQEVFVDSTLQFAVTATPTEGDPVTLTVSNAPAGAVFYPTNEIGTFVWNNASPTGEYSVVFYATDKDGSNGEAVGIYVYPLPRVGMFEVPPGSPASATFNSVLDQVYRLEYTLDLAVDPVVWWLADSETGTGGSLTLTDDNPVDARRYYRITIP